MPALDIGRSDISINGDECIKTITRISFDARVNDDNEFRIYLSSESIDKEISSTLVIETELEVDALYRYLGLALDYYRSLPKSNA